MNPPEFGNRTTKNRRVWGSSDDDYARRVVVVDLSECPELGSGEDVYLKIVSNFERVLAKQMTADLIEASNDWKEELLSRPSPPKKPKTPRKVFPRPDPVPARLSGLEPWRYSRELRLQKRPRRPQYHVGTEQLENQALFTQLWSHEEMMNIETTERVESPRPQADPFREEERLGVASDRDD